MENQDAFLFVWSVTEFVRWREPGRVSPWGFCSKVSNPSMLTHVHIRTCPELKSHEWLLRMFLSSVVSGWSQTHLQMSHPFSMPLLVPAYRHLPTYQGPNSRTQENNLSDLNKGTHQYRQLSYPHIITRILDNLLDHQLENLLYAAPDHTPPDR